jgi:beta-glucosidase
LLTGADFWSLKPQPAAGLRRVVVSDGPAGVRGQRWDERDTSANVPCPSALAASWDEQLASEIGNLLAFEARRKGVDVLLAPTVNLHRTPFAGRHFECFSEDPLLTAKLAAAYVRGVQEGGVAATVKHFVANDSETERMTVDVRVEERALRELYLAPFEMIVDDARPWAIMASYNGVNGRPMTESPLLRKVLHAELQFDGLVMSDWFATRSTEASARAGLDLVMPGRDGPWGTPLIEAIRGGTVNPAAIDDKVVRILRLAARVGALEGATAATPREYNEAAIAATLRRAAAAGFVLASNRRGLLPLERRRLHRIAVIGPNAATARTLGGGSATVFPPYAVSPLDGLRAALEPAVQVDHALGVNASSRVPVARAPWLMTSDEAGVEVRFLDDAGRVLFAEQRSACAFHWTFDGPEAAPAKIEIRAALRATEPGTYAIGCSGVGRYRLVIGSSTVFDGRLDLPPGADLVEGLLLPPQAVHRVRLGEREAVEVTLDHEPGGAGFGVSFELNLAPPRRPDDRELEHAETLAAGADAVVLVVGTTEETESEGFDRASLSLPGGQDELVRRVAAVNPNTIVAVNAGAPVLLPWADDVAAVLLTWFPGQEFGNALADVLLGDAEPGGRLPTTWPRAEAGLPSTRPVAGVLDYSEGLRVGYRDRAAAGRARYPFGHGLGYTSWEYVSIDTPAAATAQAPIAVTVVVRNTGTRPGAEVVQLYAARAQSRLERPERWLVGFAIVHAGPHEQVAATITVARRAFEHWNVDAERWDLEPGSFELAAGSSSAVLPLATSITITGRGAQNGR